MAAEVPGVRPRRPLVIGGAGLLLDDVARLVAAAGTEADVALDGGAARLRWSAAPVVIVGDDAARSVGAAGLPRRPGVILVGVDLDDASIYARGVEIGAEHVVFLPDAETWLVQRVAEAMEGADSSALVIGVLGGRGGAGATTLAVSLALSARRAGRSTLLIDADPLGGGIDLALGGERSAGLRWPDLGSTQGRVSAAALRDALPEMHDLTVLSWDRCDGPEPSEAAMRAVLGAGCRAGGVVVVDLPRRTDDASRVVLERADLTLLVVPAELRATAAAGRVAATAGLVARDLRVVVRGPAPAGLSARAVAGCLGLPLLASLRPEPGLAAAYERGEPPAQRDRGPLSRFCRSLFDEWGPELARPAAA